MTPTPEKSAARGWKGRLALLLFTLVVTVGFAELALRLIGYRVPELVTASLRRTYRANPGAEFVYKGYLEGAFSDFANPVRLNDQGFHDVDHSLERTNARTFRVLVIGDSYVAALSVPLEQTFFRRLEARLNREKPLGCGNYEVIAMGRGNQGQEKELAYLRDPALAYAPDVVLLLFFCGNDIMENGAKTYKQAQVFAEHYKQDLAPRKEALFRRLMIVPGSRLNGLLAEVATMYYAKNLHRFVRGIRPEDLVSPELGVYATPPAPEWERAYARTSELLAEMRDACERLGAPLHVAILSGPQAIGDVGMDRAVTPATAGFDPGRPEHFVTDWCSTQRVPCVSLAPALVRAGKRHVFWRHDGHLNPVGNEAIVEPIYGLLTNSPSVRAAAARRCAAGHLPAS